jgi:hypothetical protein
MRSGNDTTIKHIMSGLNPQGCRVTAFKQPSDEELDHDYLWRCHKALPPRGSIGIFNRSYEGHQTLRQPHRPLRLSRPPIIEQIVDGHQPREFTTESIGAKAIGAAAALGRSAQAPRLSTLASEAAET